MLLWNSKLKRFEKTVHQVSWTLNLQPRKRVKSLFHVGSSKWWSCNKPDADSVLILTPPPPPPLSISASFNGYLKLLKATPDWGYTERKEVETRIMRSLGTSHLRGRLSTNCIKVKKHTCHWLVGNKFGEIINKQRWNRVGLDRSVWVVCFTLAAWSTQ